RVGDRGHAEVELSRRDAGKDRAEARAYDLHLEAHDGGQRLCQVGIHAHYRLPVGTDELVGRVMRVGGDDQYALRLDCSWNFRCDLGVDAGRNGCRRVRGCGRARALLAATAAPGREGGDRENHKTRWRRDLPTLHTPDPSLLVTDCIVPQG